MWLCLGNNSLHIIPKYKQENKKHYQNEKLSYFKGHYQESEKAAYKLGQIFSNHMSNKGLV